MASRTIHLQLYRNFSWFSYHQLRMQILLPRNTIPRPFAAPLEVDRLDTVSRGHWGRKIRRRLRHSMACGIFSRIPCLFGGLGQTRPGSLPHCLQKLRFVFEVICRLARAMVLAFRQPANPRSMTPGNLGPVLLSTVNQSGLGSLLARAYNGLGNFTRTLRPLPRRLRAALLIPQISCRLPMHAV